MARFLSCLLLFATLALAACTGDDDDSPLPDDEEEATPTEVDEGETADTPEDEDTPEDDDTPVQAEEVEGHWSGDWGDLYLETDAEGVTRGTYQYRRGTVLGRLEDGRFVGWWCEEPSRQPDPDAGDVELTFIRRANGTLAVDGRWRFGTSGDWNENWDLELVDTPIDEETKARLQNDGEFCEHP
jgi:hypothetical protein